MTITTVSHTFQIRCDRCATAYTYLHCDSEEDARAKSADRKWTHGRYGDLCPRCWLDTGNPPQLAVARG